MKILNLTECESVSGGRFEITWVPLTDDDKFSMTLIAGATIGSVYASAIATNFFESTAMILTTGTIIGGFAGANAACFAVYSLPDLILYGYESLKSLYRA